MIRTPPRLPVLCFVLLVCVGAWLAARRLADAYDRPYARVEPGLYIGQAVDHPPKGTEAVVNLSLRPNAYTVQADLWEPMLETGNRPSEESLRRAVDFIAEQRRAGRTTYVHCLAGQNRSGTVVVAYLMREYGWSLEKALVYVRKRRPQVNPNPFMMRLLTDWERELRGEYREYTRRNEQHGWKGWRMKTFMRPWPLMIAGAALVLFAVLPCMAENAEKAGEKQPSAEAGPNDPENPVSPADGADVAGSHGRESATNTLVRVHVFVSGRVQGVGFRNFVRFKATVLKLNGWVRNLPDKRVELVAEGSSERIEQLMEAVAKGPSGARVDKIERKSEPYKGEFKRFETRR